MGKRLKTAGPSLDRTAEVIVRSSQPMPKTCEVVGAWIHSMPRARPRRSATLPRLPPTEASCKATTSGRSAASCSTTISSRSFRSAPLPMSPDHGPPCRRLKVTTRTVCAWLWPTVIASRRLATTTDRQRIARLTGRTGSCTTREARRPLLAEGGHAFCAVGGAGGDRLVARLHVQAVLERHAESLVEARLGQPVRHGRPLGQPLGELPRLVLELLRGDHAAHEADPQRLLRVDDVGEQDQLHGLGRADEAWEQVCPPAVRHETHAREDLTEARRVGRDPQIGGQRDVQAGSRGHAVDAAENGFLEPLHAKDTAVQALDERSTEIALEERRRALAATLLIAAGGERPSSTGEDYRSHRGVGLELDEHALHRAHHRLV